MNKIPGRTKRGVYLSCETCKKEFYVPPSRIRQAERHGNTTRYCSHKCYDKNGSKNPFYGKKHSKDTIKKLTEHPNRPVFKTGKDNPNFLRYAENTFVGASIWWWKKWFRKNFSECEGCGWGEHKEILEIHHLDLNTKNNVRENLRLFCPNCHEWWHYQRKNGKYNWLEYHAKKRAKKNQN